MNDMLLDLYIKIPLTLKILSNTSINWVINSKPTQKVIPTFDNIVPRIARSKK